MDIQRYKVGYYTDEWGMRSNTPCLIKDSQGYAVKFEDYEQLTARVRELEEFKANVVKECASIIKHAHQDIAKQLSASQLHAEQLREALTTCVCAMQDYQAGIGITELFDEGERLGRKALALPRDTSALDAYVAEKVKDAKESLHYQSKAITTLTQQRDLAVEALTEIRTFPRYRMPADIANEALSTIKESEGKRC